MRLALAIILALASTADARTIKLDKDGLTAWVPDGWTVANPDAATTTATAPNNGASATFLTQPIRDLDLAYKNLSPLMRQMLPTIQFGQAQRTTVANLAAIQVGAVADVATQQGNLKFEAHIIVLITPGQRALYVITVVQAENAAAFDGPIRKILGGLAQAAGAGQPSAPKDNPCWEMKGQPNGWSRRDWNGVSFLLPPGWSATEGKNPDTDAPFLQIAAQDGSSILMFPFAAARHDAAWQALGGQLSAYGVGEAQLGEVAGQRALCARGSASDAVVFHKGGTALAMLARAASDPSAMRGILGSIRWR
jgi:hypothetical protein